MSVHTAKTHFRAREEQLMRASCTIERRGGKTWDDNVGDYTWTWTLVYSGKCRLSQPQKTTNDAESGGASWSIADFVVSVPLDTSVQVDDKVTVTASDDPEAVGLELVVVGVPKSDWQVVRKLMCQQFTVEPT